MLIPLLVLYLSLVEPLVLLRIEFLQVSVSLLASASIHVYVSVPLNDPQLLSCGRLHPCELGYPLNQDGHDWV